MFPRAASQFLIGLALLAVMCTPGAVQAQDAAASTARSLTIEPGDAEVLRPQYVAANNARVRINPESQVWKVRYNGPLVQIDFLGTDRRNVRWAHTLLVGSQYPGNLVIVYTKTYRSGCDERQIRPFYVPTAIPDVEFNALMELETWWTLCREDDPAVRQTRGRIQYAYCKRKQDLVTRRILKWGAEPPGLQEARCLQVLARRPA
jgi:hypothetical protein